ncbi:MAG: ArnT family glycosyltransferase [Planctomycetota bacterium]|jgi:hypothetical protein
MNGPEGQADMTAGTDSASPAPPENGKRISRAVLINLVVLLAVVLGIRIAVVISPQDFRDSYAIPAEDGYCYFLIGRNMAEGRGMTFDGIRATNGIHPLWQVIVAGAFFLFGAAAPVFVLFLGALLDTATAFIVFLIARKVTGRNAPGLIAVAVYGLFYQSVFYNALNGSDTAISVFFFTTLTYLCFLMAENPSWRRTIIFGIVGGLTFLARTDNAILLVVAFAALFIFSLKGRERFTKLLSAGLVLVAIASPWLIYNQAKFGSIMQQSAVTNSYVFHEEFRIKHGSGWPIFVESLRLVSDSIFNQLPRMSGISKGAFLVLIAFIVIAWVIRFKGNLKEKFPDVINFVSRIKPLLIPAIAIIVMIIIHSGFRWLARRTYLQRATPLWAVLIAVTIMMLVYLFRTRRREFVIAAVIAPVFYAGFAGYGLYRMWEPSKSMLFQTLLHKCGKYVKENIPEDTVIAMHVSGAVVSYISGRDVIDLSGNVNPEMLEIYKNRRITAYLRDDLKADYLVSGITGIRAIERFATEKLAPYAEEIQVFPPDIEYDYMKKFEGTYPAIYRLRWDKVVPGTGD